MYIPLAANDQFLVNVVYLRHLTVYFPLRSSDDLKPKRLHSSDLTDQRYLKAPKRILQSEHSIVARILSNIGAAVAFIE